MNKLKSIFFFWGCLIAQISYSQIPDSYLGRYTGSLYGFRNNTSKEKLTNMELTVGPLISVDSGNEYRYHFIIKYDGQIRKYEWIWKNTYPARSYIDEKNGIKLDAQLLDETLMSEFKVENYSLFSQYKFMGDSIRFNITTKSTKPQLSIVNSFDDDQHDTVYSYPILGHQTAVLTRVKTPQVNVGQLISFPYFNSKSVTSRHVDVWLPEDYNPSRKYGVIYLHDGQNLFDANSTWNHQEWGIDEALTKYNSKAEKLGGIEFIAVGIWNDGVNRHSNYFPQKVYEMLTPSQKDSILAAKRNRNSDLFSNPINSDDYLKFIVSELKPFIDSTYSTLSSSDYTVIAGSSMGGLISMYAICEYPQVFGAAGCFSTHWPGIFEMNNNPIPDAMVKYFSSNLPSPKNHKFLFTHGTEGLDSLYGPIQKRIDKVIQKKYPQNRWKIQVDQGLGHQETTWQKQFDENLDFLLK
jgi:predicted alpha/beta superfamily hydrolase